MSWLEHIKPEGLRDWIRYTYVPMLASLPDGTILWANPSCERLTGYTLPELEKLSWRDLTIDIDDREADIEMALATEAGERKQYQIRKQYKHKTGMDPQVLIDVLRHPQNGEFKCFFVSIIPLDEGYDQALKEVKKLRLIMEVFLRNEQSKPGTLDKLSVWAEKHPKMAFFTGIVTFIFLFGDRALEIIKSVMSLISFKQGP